MPGRRPVSARIVGDLVDQVGLRELARRQVDADHQRGAPPGTGVRQRAPAGRPSRAPSGRSATIRPVSSASGMNDSGGTSPRVGCCQRTSASKPTIRLRREVDDRLVVERAARRARGPAAGRSRASSRSSVWRAHRRVEQTCRAGRVALRPDAARSRPRAAARRASPDRAGRSRCRALALMNHSRPLEGERGPQLAAIDPLRDPLAPRPTSRTPSRMIPNSSPPNRATVSPGRRHAASRCPDRDQQPVARRRGRGSR